MKSPRGGGAFYHLFQTLAKKSPTPPGPFHEKPLYFSYFLFHKGDFYEIFSAYLKWAKQKKKNHPPTKGFSREPPVKNMDGWQGFQLTDDSYSEPASIIRIIYHKNLISSLRYTFFKYGSN